MDRISKRFGDGAGIKWLTMPWQPLVASDRAVLAAVEESLVNSLDTTLVVHTCQFVTNVMLQDFPAEVFLQRPAIAMILRALLERSRVDGGKVVPAVTKALHKLTRSLRYRIYYYCDPCIANKRPSIPSGRSESSWACESSSDDRESPEGALPEANYQAYQQQRPASQDSPTIIVESSNVDDSPLLQQQQQMFLPTYCAETLKEVLSLLVSLPSDETSPLRNVKNILDLASELVLLLTTSLRPSIWLATDSLSLSVNDNLKSLATLLGELARYYGSSSFDCHRIIYLQVVCLIGKLLSAIVPLELADVVLPKVLKVSITQAVIDAPIFLMYPGLNSTMEQYARLFTDPETTELMQLFDETRYLTASLEAAISLMRDSSSNVRSHEDTLKIMWDARSSLSYHKRLSIVKKFVSFLQDVNVLFEDEERELANKLILDLLSNANEDIRRSAYAECRDAVSATLGVEAKQIGRYAWIKVAFLLEPRVLTEIVCHGAAGEDETIKSLAEDILVYVLKGKVHLGEEGWSKLLDEALVRILGLLQCLAATTSVLGQCVTKMLDPDVYASIKLPYLEVIKGNARLLYAADSALREEALCRLIFLLGREKDSSKKLPRLSSLHGLPLSSLCIVERSSCGFKRSEGSYQTSSLLSVLELIKTPDVEPKVRKSALVQISVMLTDSCLHKLFVRENGLPLILDIMNKSLIEKEYGNYPDSVIPVLSILKILASTQCSVRHDLSTRPEVFSNILRGLFLFPNNDCVKIDASQLLCLLLYSEYILMPTTARENEYSVISLPHVVATRMRLPVNCKSHWRTSVHTRADLSIVNSSNPIALTFVRQFWAWHWNGADSTALFAPLESLNDGEISEKLQITRTEFFALRYTSVYFCARHQLLNIENSTTHLQVAAALDYLSMYLKLWKMLMYESSMDDLSKLPWEQSFVRFLLSQPTNKEDCELFVDVLNFLYVYINAEMSDQNNAWLCNIIRKNVTRSLGDLAGTISTDNQEVHEAVLKLVRSASAIEETRQLADELQDEDSWIGFIELIVSNLCFGDQQPPAQQQKQQQQQHFYNLAYLDWLLRCLTYLTNKCQWRCHKNLLTSLGNSLIELIVSFYGAGTVSFMGLSITRNSIICLNHLLYEMQRNFGKTEWLEFWYDEDRNLSWLPMLWKNRDPLVRASAFQLLAALTSAEHTAPQLLKAVVLAPSELCHTLLRYLTNREECCIVREQACTALASLVKNSNKNSFQYMDSLNARALVTYVEQSNAYYEISVMCSSIYLGTTLESELRDAAVCARSDDGQSLREVNDDEDEDDDDNCRQSVTTPSLISAACTLLNNLIIIGGQDVAKHIYEQSLDKYFLGCFGEVPDYEEIERRTLAQYCDILEMYINLCTLLTNCITHCHEFATIASFSSETLNLLLKYLDEEHYYEDEGRVLYLRKSLSAEVYNFLSVLSLTESGQQHMSAIITATESSGAQRILISICQAMKDSMPELRMSSIGCLAFLLSQEIQRKSEDRESERRRCSDSRLSRSLSSVLDATLVMSSDWLHDDDDDDNDCDLRQVLSSLNKLSVGKNSRPGSVESGQEKGSARDRGEDRVPLGSEISKTLIHLFIAYNYAKSKKDSSALARDKDIVNGALSNLLGVSVEAKKTALNESLGETCLMILKEIHTEFTLQPYQINKSRSSRDKKVYPLLSDTRRVLGLLMNFSYGSVEVKERLARAGLADVLHKIWAWISLDDKTVTSALELVATFTTNCTEGTHSLTLTTTLPGSGLRRTPNAASLMSAIVNLVGREFDKAGRNFDNQKLHYAFHVLRNAVHVHECRVVITKSNLLSLFGKIHPASTKRVKPWPLLEVYCLEFLNDLTYYEEGQISVAKAPDGLDVLIELARSNTPATRLLAISTLRNLVFNSANRPRLLASAAFINLLHSTLESGSFSEIGIIGSILWSLVSNSQKGKLTIRSAGFPQSIQEVLGRLTLLNTPDERERQDLAKVLHYVVRMLSSSESRAASTEIG